MFKLVKQMKRHLSKNKAQDFPIYIAEYLIKILCRLYDCIFCNIQMMKSLNNTSKYNFLLRILPHTSQQRV